MVKIREYPYEYSINFLRQHPERWRREKNNSNRKQALGRTPCLHFVRLIARDAYWKHLLFEYMVCHLPSLACEIIELEKLPQPRGVRTCARRPHAREGRLGRRRAAEAWVLLDASAVHSLAVRPSMSVREENEKRLEFSR